MHNIPRRPWRRSRRAHQSAKAESLGQRFFRHRADDTLPLVVTHERIYILPSARGWMFVASLLVMLIASINYSLSLGYALCFLLTGLFAAALLATYRNLAGITLNSVTAATATAGDSLTWHFRFNVAPHNATSARRGIILRTSDTKTDINVDSGEAQGFTHRVVARTRGWQALGRITLSSDYPLGLWHTWCYLHVSEHALILPKPETDGPDLPTNITTDNTQTENLKYQDAQPATSGEFAGLRPYRAGDPINSIAWKAAARGQGLHSMTFTGTATTSPLTLDWNSTAAIDDTEARLSRLAHWVNLANASAIPWRLILPEHTLPLDSGTTQATLSLRALALYGQPEDPTTESEER